MRRLRALTPCLVALLLAGACSAGDGADRVTVTVDRVIDADGRTVAVITRAGGDPGAAAPGRDDGIPDVAGGDDGLPAAPGGDDGLPDAPGGDDGLPDPARVPRPLEEGGAAAAYRALAQTLGYRPEVVWIGLYGDYALFSVRDRDRPRNIDRYEWRDGRIGAPEPERMSAEEIGRRVFRPAQVDLSAVPRLVARARRVPIESPEVGGVLIARGFFGAGIAMVANVNGPRESAQVRADARGRVYQVLRSP